jgi:uncharacterized protein YifN (PemK superfamily)
MCHIWNVKRGYLMICVEVDIKKKRILSLKVNSQKEQDGNVLPELINDVVIKNNKIVQTALLMVSMTVTRIFNFYPSRE